MRLMCLLMCLIDQPCFMACLQWQRSLGHWMVLGMRRMLVRTAAGSDGMCLPPRRLCVKHVKSNAITVAKDGKLLGMGSGQPNRVKSVQIALEKAKEEVKVRRRADGPMPLECCHLREGAGVDAVHGRLGFGAGLPILTCGQPEPPRPLVSCVRLPPLLLWVLNTSQQRRTPSLLTCCSQSRPLPTPCRAPCWPRMPSSPSPGTTLWRLLARWDGCLALPKCTARGYCSWLAVRGIRWEHHWAARGTGLLASTVQRALRSLLGPNLTCPALCPTTAGGRERHCAPRRQPARPGRGRLLQQVSLG